MGYVSLDIGSLLVECLFFLTLTLFGIFIYDRMKNSSNRLFNPREFFPDDEIHSLKQVFYLVMMGASFFILLYSLMAYTDDLLAFSIIDVVISLAIAVDLGFSSTKNILLFVLLIPYGALAFIFGFSTYSLIDILHILIFIYFTKVYYDKFRQYTENNGLGITIALLFIIVFVSFLITQIVENVDPLNSLVMVSNAFTSNGYAILGNSVPGKMNSIFLVWGGYILSGVGTATLTVALVMKQFNARFDELKELIEKNNRE